MDEWKRERKRERTAGNIPVQNDNNSDDPAGRNRTAPVLDDDVAGDDFERDQGGFEDEEVVASRDTESFVDVTAGETNKG